MLTERPFRFITSNSGILFWAVYCSIAMLSYHTSPIAVIEPAADGSVAAATK